jgi:CRP-like cAMP-binding protein
MEPFEILKDNEILKGLNEEEVKEIAEICIRKEYKNGSIIFEENRKDSEMYIPLEGKADM